MQATDTKPITTRRRTLSAGIAAIAAGIAAPVIAKATGSTPDAEDVELVALAADYDKANAEIQRLEALPELPDDAFEALDAVRYRTIDRAVELPATTAAGRQAKARILVGEDELLSECERSSQDDLALALANDVLAGDAA